MNVQHTTETLYFMNTLVLNYLFLIWTIIIIIYLLNLKKYFKCSLFYLDDFCDIFVRC